MMAHAADIERLCLFAHYDASGVIAEHVRIYLAALGQIGFKIVVISTAKLDGDPTHGLPEAVIDVIIRENSGIDFGSWARGYRDWAHRCAGDLLFANDSVYAPVGDLGPVIAALDSDPADIRGVVASNEIQPHLQSWFLLFRPKVWRHPDFIAFLGQPFGDYTKDQVIVRGEVGLSDVAQRNGFSTSALFPHRDRMLPTAIPANPMHFLWREIVCDHHLPFIKVQLLRDNPMELQDVGVWRSVVAERMPELLGPIEQHLEKTSQPGVLDPPRRSLNQRLVRAEYVAAMTRHRFGQRLSLLGFRMLPWLVRIRNWIEAIPIVGPRLVSASRLLRGR